MIVLVDADSLVWASCYKKKEHPEDEPYHTLEDAKLKFDEVIMSIVNRIEDDYEIDKLIIFSGSKGNFRKQISKTYKANRENKPKPEFLNEMHQYVKDNYDSQFGNGFETDDLVATYWKKMVDTFGRDEVIIVSIDKDYKQLPCIIYDYHYKKQCYYDITESDARYNFWEQMIAGDSSDNVNYCKGYGVAYCKKAFKDCQSNYSFIRRVFSLYKEIYKGKAREKFLECYQLLKLKQDL
jgi:5'-3' exonuclease